MPAILRTDLSVHELLPGEAPSNEDARADAGRIAPDDEGEIGPWGSIERIGGWPGTDGRDWSAESCRPPTDAGCPDPDIEERVRRLDRPVLFQVMRDQSRRFAVFGRARARRATGERGRAASSTPGLPRPAQSDG